MLKTALKVKIIRNISIAPAHLFELLGVRLRVDHSSLKASDFRLELELPLLSQHHLLAQTCLLYRRRLFRFAPSTRTKRTKQVTEVTKISKHDHKKYIYIYDGDNIQTEKPK